MILPSEHSKWVGRYTCLQLRREVRVGNGRGGPEKAFIAMRIAETFLVKREQGLGQIPEALQCLGEEKLVKEKNKERMVPQKPEEGTFQNVPFLTVSESIFFFL